jgi:hypothetical protein
MTVGEDDPHMHHNDRVVIRLVLAAVESPPGQVARRAANSTLLHRHAFRAPYGVPAASAPVFCYSGSKSGDVAATYLDSFEMVWGAADPIE